jgi:hypothetical protein
VIVITESECCSGHVGDDGPVSTTVTRSMTATADGAAMTFTVNDAERATVGAVLLQPHHLSNLEPWLCASDFADPLARSMYALLLEMHQRQVPIDPDAVLSAALKQGALGPTGSPGAQIVDLLQAPPDPRVCLTYGRIVLDASIRRKVVEVGERLVQLGTAPERVPAEILDLVREQQETLATERDRWRAARHTSVLASDRLDATLVPSLVSVPAPASHPVTSAERQASSPAGLARGR